MGNYGQNMNAGANSGNFPNAAGGQGGMSQYLSNLNKGYSGAELGDANIQKYLHLLNPGSNNFPGGAGNPQQTNPGGGQNLPGRNPASQGNFSSTLPGGGNPGAGMQDDKQVIRS